MKDRGLQLVKSGNGFDLDMQVKRDAQGLITHGLVVGDILNQNLALLLLVKKGEVKEYPLLGVGIDDILNDNELAFWYNEIESTMKQDGLVVEQLNMSQQGLSLKAKYN